MSEKKFKLRVPAAEDLPEGFPEYVEQGYLSTELPRGEVIEVADERFAHWLVRDLGLELVEEPQSDPQTGEYAADFPGRVVLMKLGVTPAKVRELDREQLIALDGIGEKTADAILAAVGGEN